MRRIMMVWLCIMFLSGCGTVTISPEGNTYRYTSTPDYIERKPFYLWGLVPTHQIDVKKACEGETAKQMQAQHTIRDSVLTLLTLGIYAPRTAKVWCDS